MLICPKLGLCIFSKRLITTLDVNLKEGSCARRDRSSTFGLRKAFLLVIGFERISQSSLFTIAGEAYC